MYIGRVSNAVGAHHEMTLLCVHRTCESDHFNCQADGSMRSRTMSVLFFALGVDQFFSYTGNTSFLREMLPQIDLTMKWVNNHSDSSGLFECGTIGTVSCPGPMGMDWVDWHQSRAVGKTFIFESWYAWTLRRIAALHEEFASSSFGSARLSAVYHARADSIVSALRRGYWMEDHWRTNEAQVSVTSHTSITVFTNTIASDALFERLKVCL
jgi:glycogen debranching enzyme